MTDDIKKLNPSQEKGFFLSFFKRKEKPITASESLKEAVDAYLEESTQEELLSDDEQEETVLLSNVLSLKDSDVTDIMIPRADIVGIEVSSSVEELLELLTERQYSRLPVYKETLDEILGTIHIKDILAKMAKNEPFDIKSLTRDAPIVSPAMPILDLVNLMRQERRHMVMVVDEYGGIDGLVTIGDITEELLGEIDDEYDTEEKLVISKGGNNSFIMNARTDLDELEEEIGIKLQVEDDDIDTIGGLVSSVAGRLPSRGEIIDAPDLNVQFKVLDSDPRKIKRVQLILLEPEMSSSEGSSFE